MRFLALAILVCLIGVSAKAQDTSKIDLSKYDKVMLDDSSWVFVLKGFTKVEKDNYYRRMRYKVKKLYPFAIHAVDLLSTLGEEETSDVSRSTKKEAKKANKELKQQFRQSILDMSTTEGNILCKLIHRETGMTAYQIIRKYRGGAKALYWQSISRLGGADLKQQFDPKKDLVLNRVMRDVDRGKIKVPKEPKLLTKDERKRKKKKKKGPTTASNSKVTVRTN